MQADALSNIGRVGPLVRDDVPLSAIDFHVSSIVEELMQVPQIAHIASAEAAKVTPPFSSICQIW